MADERFFNYYVEILNSTLHEALGKNIVFQTQAKISGEDIESLKNTISNLESKVEQFEGLEKNIEDQGMQLSQKEQELQKILQERDSARNEASHIDTFRNELVSARNELVNKNAEINGLNSEKQLLLQKISRTESIENELKIANEKISEYLLDIKNLEDQINYLKMTPAQRRKYDQKNNKIDNNVVTEDGGSF